ncbi:MAG: YihA family ribosome biogenesis GTP-binding protein [Candidatus Zixiibacteriota bacterium]|nr:MAG: YihA family ribosome biogenesis GTP-binding protein [candidate division Zixibacteria bacterium]
MVVKELDCRYIGSFYKYAQLPKDNRPQVAFAGRSNVGKSSLLNKLTGRKKLAKVSNTPGKTRSLNFYLVNDRFYFVDLPGYGYARASKSEQRDWARLIEDYLENSDRLAGLVVLLDCRREITEQDAQLFEWLAAKELPGIAVVTKADKLRRDKLNRKVRDVETETGFPAIPFSIVTGAGKREVQSAVLALVEKYQ